MMDRRNFLRLAQLAGLAVVPLAAVQGRRGRARAGTGAAEIELYTGPLFVTVHAAGGWDPTLLCDPKGHRDDDPDAINRTYHEDDIAKAGNIRFAPLAPNIAFFEKYYPELLVLNGVDVQTNGHDSGTRHLWSGRLSGGFPSFAALAAAQRGHPLPMAYLSFGGYDATASVVARTRSGDSRMLARVANPERNGYGKRYHEVAAESRVAQARVERDLALYEDTRLIPRRRAMSALFAARTGADQLVRLKDYLPATLDNGTNPLRRQAQVAIAAYRAGICVSCNLTLDGFDTHAAHDARHATPMADLLAGVDFLMEEAARHGVRDRMIVIMGSDFGRDPTYNSGNGKDHWPITSVMAMGAGITGNRVIGATDEALRALPIDPDTLALSSSGVRIDPTHIHAALRRLAGVAGSQLDQAFPIRPPRPLERLFG